MVQTKVGMTNDKQIGKASVMLIGGNWASAYNWAIQNCTSFIRIDHDLQKVDGYYQNHTTFHFAKGRDATWFRLKWI